MGYSIGKWVDEDGAGRYSLLEVETRNMKGPRAFDPSGIPLHRDNQTVVKERIYLDKANSELLHDEITTIDHALTRPWTVMKNYRRNRNPRWVEAVCMEANPHVRIGQGELHDERGRLSHAREERPAAARFALLQSGPQVTTTSRVIDPKPTFDMRLSN